MKKDSEKLTVLPTVVEVPLKATVQKAGLSLETELVQAKVTKASKDGWLTQMTRKLVSIASYQISSGAIRSMLALTFLLATQIVSYLLINCIRKRLLKALNYTTLGKLMLSAIRLALRLANAIWNGH